MQKVLEKRDTFSFKVETPVQPNDFFQDREGLSVWTDFKERVLSKAKAIEAGKEFRILPGDLLTRTIDAIIESALPEEHLFSESDVCAIIAELITKQPKGEEGVLKNDGYSNLFYTPSFVVSVCWDVSRWYVATWDRGDSDWNGAYRVFSPAVS